MTDPAPRRVNGVPLPPRPTAIDEHGYERTKHALRFRGADWAAVLNHKRADLTSHFLQEAAAATCEPEEHIQQVRFSIDPQGRLVAKFTVRHKAQTVQSVVQDRLALFPFRNVTALYVPAAKRPRPAARAKSQRPPAFSSGRHGCLNVSFFGRNQDEVGPNGPEFRDEKEEEEDLQAADPERPRTHGGISMMV